MENELGNKGSFTKNVLAVAILALILVIGNLFVTSLLTNRTVYSDGWAVVVYGQSGNRLGRINTLVAPNLERDKNDCLTIEKEKFCGTSITVTISPKKICIDRCP